MSVLDVLVDLIADLSYDFSGLRLRVERKYISAGIHLSVDPCKDVSFLKRSSFLYFVKFICSSPR